MFSVFHSLFRRRRVKQCIVVFPWTKKPDVELVDPSGEFLTLYLDVTLPALHQEAIASRADFFLKDLVLEKSKRRHTLAKMLLVACSLRVLVYPSFCPAWAEYAKRGTNF